MVSSVCCVSSHCLTGVRDYIHVVDLAVGHVASLQLFEREQPVGCVVSMDMSVLFACMSLNVRVHLRLFVAPMLFHVVSIVGFLAVLFGHMYTCFSCLFAL